LEVDLLSGLTNKNKTGPPEKAVVQDQRKMGLRVNNSQNKELEKKGLFHKRIRKKENTQRRKD
jgi:hypothetical protein